MLAADERGLEARYARIGVVRSRQKLALGRRKTQRIDQNFMIKCRSAVVIHLLSCLLAISAGGCAKRAHVEPTKQVSKAVAAPPGTESLVVRWIEVASPALGTTILAVAKPTGRGPFPVALILHGTHGFAQEYVELAQALAANGVVGVAACWIAGGRGAGMRYITPIACPDAPPLADASSSSAQKTISALVQAVRNLEGVRVDRLILVGHSRGAGAILNHALKNYDVDGVVLNSAGYPPDLKARASEIKVPVLLLHGSADSPLDGGSAVTNVQMARDFESALRRAGKPVDAKYYDGAGHNALFTDLNQFHDEVAQIIAFLQRLPRR